MLAHGEAWTVKDLFVYPNEFIYWSIQIVMYPFMTGLVAGAFVLSSLYHVFGVTRLKEIARFSLVFSFSLLLVAPLPLIFHLQQPLRSLNVFLTPHFTSAIAAFGIVFSAYGALVAMELWLIYRCHWVATLARLRAYPNRSLGVTMRILLLNVLTLGALDVSEEARSRDAKAVRVLAAVGIPVAGFLHGYAGFIFGSVKANALWMTPLMPVIFIMSAVVSGIALSMLTYIGWQWISRTTQRRPHGDDGSLEVVRSTARYLLLFMVFAMSLEVLDLVFRGYTAVKTWDVVRSVIYGRDFVNIFVVQYGLGGILPLLLLLTPNLTTRRAILSLLLVLLGVFMMRWNVVIGGQAFSLTFSGYMEYKLPIVPHNLDTFREGLTGALLVMLMPFVLFSILGRIIPPGPPLTERTNEAGV